MMEVTSIQAHSPAGASRDRLVRRGRRLSFATLAFDALEGIAALWAGVAAGSPSLVGFGADSWIEVAASLTAIWRLNADASPERRERAERHARRLIGLSFVALASYIALDAAIGLGRQLAPSPSIAGIAVAVASLVVMPLLARAKRRVAVKLSSGALRSESRQTDVCAYLSAILLAGLALNALFGWWWADAAAALTMVPLIAWEGIQGLRGEDPCCDDCC